jgi:hypothetical protein
MPAFLVESYIARGDAATIACHAHRARLAASELTQAGTPVRFVRSIFVPADEIFLLVYDAPVASAVRVAVERAGLSCDSLAPAVEDSGVR